MFFHEPTTNDRVCDQEDPLWREADLLLDDDLFRGFPRTNRQSSAIATLLSLPNQLTGFIFERTIAEHFPDWKQLHKPLQTLAYAVSSKSRRLTMFLLERPKTN